MIDYTSNHLGDVNFNGIVVHLKQNAFADNSGTDGGVAYFAMGIDDNGNEYEVRWETTLEWDALQDSLREDDDKQFQTKHGGDIPEDEACDWNKYTIRAI